MRPVETSITMEPPPAAANKDRRERNDDDATSATSLVSEAPSVEHFNVSVSDVIYTMKYFMRAH